MQKMRNMRNMRKTLEIGGGVRRGDQNYIIRRRFLPVSCAHHNPERAISIATVFYPDATDVRVVNDYSVCHGDENDHVTAGNVELIPDRWTVRLARSWPGRSVLTLYAASRRAIIEMVEASVATVTSLFVRIKTTTCNVTTLNTWRKWYVDKLLVMRTWWWWWVTRNKNDTIICSVPPSEEAAVDDVTDDVFQQDAQNVEGVVAVDAGGAQAVAATGQTDDHVDDHVDDGCIRPYTPAHIASLFPFQPERSWALRIAHNAQVVRPVWVVLFTDVLLNETSVAMIEGRSRIAEVTADVGAVLPHIRIQRACEFGRVHNIDDDAVVHVVRSCVSRHPLLLGHDDVGWNESKDALFHRIISGARLMTRSMSAMTTERRRLDRTVDVRLSARTYSQHRPPETHGIHPELAECLQHFLVHRCRFAPTSVPLSSLYDDFRRSYENTFCIGVSVYATPPAFCDAIEYFNVPFDPTTCGRVHVQFIGDYAGREESIRGGVLDLPPTDIYDEQNVTARVPSMDLRRDLVMHPRSAASRISPWSNPG